MSLLSQIWTGNWMRPADRVVPVDGEAKLGITMPQKRNPGSGKVVRSVIRALELLQAINRNREPTINDLHRQTKLPKSSILRFLRTFEEMGLIARTSGRGVYRLQGAVTALSGTCRHESPVVLAAEEHMIEFTKTDGWPLALGLPDGDAVVVSASTIPHTSMYHAQSSLNIRLNLIDFALGRAFLAQCHQEARNLLIAAACRSSIVAKELAVDEIEVLLNESRTLGYSVRNSAIEMNTSTIAVPIMVDGLVTASLGLTWLTAAMTKQEAIETYAGRLTDLSKTISRALNDSQDRSSDAGQLDGNSFLFGGIRTYKTQHLVQTS